MVAAGGSKAAHGSRFWNRVLRNFSTAARTPAWAFTSSAVIHRAVFPIYYAKEGKKYGVIAQQEIEMAHNK